MSASFQNAVVAYSRGNGTILHHSFTSTPSTSMILNSSQVLEAYDHLLFDTTTFLHNDSAPLPLFSGSSFPTFLWLADPEFSDANARNPATSTNAYGVLQSLLAIPLYYCQTGVARRLIPPVTDAKSVSNPSLSQLYALLSPLPDRDSPATLAYHRFEILASLPTLISYMALMGVALLGCVIAQAVISLRMRHGADGRGGLPDLSSFPALDAFAHCTIEDGRRCVVYQGRSGALLFDPSDGRSLVSWLSELRVRWARPARDEDGLRLFSFQDTARHGYGDRLDETRALQDENASLFSGSRSRFLNDGYLPKRGR